MTYLICQPVGHGQLGHLECVGFPWLFPTPNRLDQPPALAPFDLAAQFSLGNHRHQEKNPPSRWDMSLYCSQLLHWFS